MIINYSIYFLKHKKHPNSEKRVLNYQKLVCEEFLIYQLYCEVSQISTVLITKNNFVNSFLYR